MKETSCDVIRDLLPLYEDNAVSEDTAQMVREHLKDCPACREELQKMRTPVSMPPDGDEQAVKRFLEHRAEVRRKQNIKIACVVSALAVVIVFCLCYTLIPRSWAFLCRLEKVDSVFVTAHEIYFKPTNGEEISPIDWHFWNLNADGDSIPAQQLLNTLDEVVFLPKFSNLRNYTPFPRENYTVIGAGSIVHLFLYTQDLQDSFDVNVYSNGLVIIRDAKGSAFIYGTRENPYEALASIVREYGTLQEE